MKEPAYAVEDGQLLPVNESRLARDLRIKKAAKDAKKRLRILDFVKTQLKSQ